MYVPDRELRCRPPFTERNEARFVLAENPHFGAPMVSKNAGEPFAARRLHAGVGVSCRPNRMNV